MVLITLIMSLVVAVLLTGVFALALGRRGPWANTAAFFVVVLLAGWAGGMLLVPFGPSLFGAYWLSIVAVGLLVALLMAAGRQGHPATQAEAHEEAREAAGTAAAFDVFFVIVLIVLLMAVLVGILRGGQ